MTYEDIPGWCDFGPLYERMVFSARQGAIFVEVGCWLGRSTVLMADLIKRTRPDIMFYAVDTWKGSTGVQELLDAVAQAGGSMFPQFIANLDACGVSDFVHPIRADSIAGASCFADGELDFVFIDADHSCEAVDADITAWLPKLRVGGTLAGHDWLTFQSVREGVNDAMGRDFTVEGNCWLKEKK